MIASGHAEEDKLEALADFREWLIELREDNDKRMEVRRDGNTKRRSDGSLVYGPFKLQVRHNILDRLRALERSIGEELIAASEIDIIEDIWWRDEIRENGRINLMKDLGLEVRI